MESPDETGTGTVTVPRLGSTTVACGSATVVTTIAVVNESAKHD